jgi:hypothetical protein
LKAEEEEEEEEEKKIPSSILHGTKSIASSIHLTFSLYFLETGYSTIHY